MSVLPRLVVVLGPTGSGKSALAIRLAHELDGEVLVCDSTQIYRGFDIGTAKVLPAEQQGVPHHLVDLADAHEIFTAGEYRRAARDVLADLRRRNKLPILTAGTGLYLRALLEGLADAPTRSEALRERLAQRATKSPGHLHRLLARLDRESSQRIAPADIPKLIRAIEVCLLTGKTLTEIHEDGRDKLQGFEVVKIGLSPARADLYARLDARVTAMLNAGWLDEVRRHSEQGIPATAKPFQFIGYSQLRAHQEGRATLAEATKEIQQATRRYAKRQATWFRREKDVQWLNGFGDDPRIAAQALQMLEPTRDR
ncbi:MAG: tRNA (adenosine(37)-N6)-dimethylallyltransferase MiaA [Candidatus Acidiferrales bacterium]